MQITWQSKDANQQNIQKLERGSKMRLFETNETEAIESDHMAIKGCQSTKHPEIGKGIEDAATRNKRNRGYRIPHTS